MVLLSRSVYRDVESTRHCVHLQAIEAANSHQQETTFAVIQMNRLMIFFPSFIILEWENDYSTEFSEMLALVCNMCALLQSRNMKLCEIYTSEQAWDQRLQPIKITKQTLSLPVAYIYIRMVVSCFYLEDIQVDTSRL